MGTTRKHSTGRFRATFKQRSTIGDPGLKIVYKVSRTKAGMFGGGKFSVHITASLEPEEQAIVDEFGAATGFEIDHDRFGDVKGVNSGFMNLRDLTSESEFKFPNIQQASDFLAQVLHGLEGVKDQINRTKASADILDQVFTKAI